MNENKQEISIAIAFTFTLRPRGKRVWGKTGNDGTHCKNQVNRFAWSRVRARMYLYICVCGGSLPFVNWIYRKIPRNIFVDCVSLYRRLLQLMEVVLSFDPFYRMRCHLFIAHNNSFCEWTHISCHGFARCRFRYTYININERSRVVNVWRIRICRLADFVR